MDIATLIGLAGAVLMIIGSMVYAGGVMPFVDVPSVIIVFGGMALCDREDGHIAVDLFETAFPVWLNRIVDIFSDFLGAVIFGGIAYTVADSASISQLLNLSTNLLRLPIAWFQYAVCVFSVIGAAAMLLRAVTLIASGGYEHHTEKDVL